MQTENSWTRENVTGNIFLGNGGTELNKTSSLYDLAFRNYDPVLGRMNGVDPLASKYASLTPYNFSFNDPVTFNDPSGAEPWDEGPYGGSEAYYYAMNGESAGTAPLEVMDPSGGGGSWTWNPANAGGYGVAGSGMYNNYIIPNQAAAITSRNLQMYHDKETLSQQDFAAKYGDRYYLKTSWDVEDRGNVQDRYSWSIALEFAKYDRVLEPRSKFWDWLDGKRTAEVNGQWTDVDSEGYPTGYLTMGGTPDFPIGRAAAAKNTVMLVKEGTKIVAKTAKQAPKLWKAMKQQMKTPKTTPSVGKPVIPEFIERAESQLQHTQNPGFWSRVRESLLYIGQYFGG